MQKKIKGYINASIWTSIAFVMLGILAIIFPQTLLNMIRWIISIFCLSVGIFLVTSDFSRRTIFPFFSAAALGAIMLIIGMIFAMNEGIMGLFSIVIGAWFVITAIASLRFSSALRGYSGYGISTVSAILSLICGIVLIVNPWSGSEAMMSVIGVFIVIYAASNLIEMLVLKRNLHDIAKSFNGPKAKKSPKIKEAKTVKKK